jgi:hypothetical protein
MLNCARCKINLLSQADFSAMTLCIISLGNVFNFLHLPEEFSDHSHNLIIPVRVTFSINTRAYLLASKTLFFLAFIFFYFPKRISLGRKTPLFTSKSSFLMARWARSAHKKKLSLLFPFPPPMLVFPRSVHFQVKRLLLLLKRLLGARSQGSLSSTSKRT